MLVIIVAALAATAAAQSAFTTCNCTSDPNQHWDLPAAGSAAPISMRGDPTVCWQLEKTVGTRTCDGLCVYLGPCSDPNTPTWRIDSKDSYDLVVVASAGPAQNWCLDQNTVELYVQAYACIDGDTHQTWTVQDSAIVELWDGADGCVAPPGPTCKPPVPPGAEYCPQYHVVQGKNLYDPSGPLLAPDGFWHVWEDDGGWSHYRSTDLLRWERVLPASTGFTGLTGSVSITSAGAFAFWPEGNQAGIDSAVARDVPNFTSWAQRGMAIPVPSYAGQNFRDPTRAFYYEGDWYVGVGCNNNSRSADLCIYRAADNTLAKFENAGSMLTVTTTFGQMTSDIVWINVSVPAVMMECPDVFPIGPDGDWMIIGSLYSTNQWWTGKVDGNPPRFTPASVGMMDYGNGYAVKTGTTFAASPTDRRVQFAFTGWNEPTKVPVCGRAFILPRDITLSGGTPRFNPIPETASLHSTAADAHATAVVDGDSAPSAALGTGSRVQLNALCTLGATPPAGGRAFFRVLGAPDGSHYTEIGYDFAAQALYSNHTACCAAPNTIVQRAPQAVGGLMADRALNMTVFVDGGLIEIFLNGRVTITTLVYPDSKSASPDARTNIFVAAVSGLTCQADSWQLITLPFPQPARHAQ